MNKTCIIGQGRWARRLKNKLHEQGRTEVDLLDSRAPAINVASYQEVFICVPAGCVEEVLNKIVWGQDKKDVISCVKGLMADGQTLCAYLNEKIKLPTDSAVGFLGGPNIDDGREIIEIEYNDQDHNKLELACILKNVYAIGFGVALNQGDNFAANELTKYLSELKSLGIEEKYWADLFVSCYSDKSRNKSFGKKFGAQEDYAEKTIEGLNTAKIIERHNLFKDLAELRKITEIITAHE